MDNSQQIRLWKLGSLPDKIYPTKEAVQKLADILVGFKKDGLEGFDLIWSADIQCETISLGSREYATLAGWEAETVEDQESSEFIEVKSINKKRGNIIVTYKTGLSETYELDTEALSKPVEFYLNDYVIKYGKLISATTYIPYRGDLYFPTTYYLGEQIHEKEPQEASSPSRDQGSAGLQSNVGTTYPRETHTVRGSRRLDS